MNKTQLNHFDNSWYSPGNKVKILVWFFLSSILLRTKYPVPQVIKKTVLKIFGCKLGKGITLKPSINIKYPWLLEIGDYVWIGENVWIDNLAKITVESNVCISQGAMLLTGNHDYKKATFDLIVKPITLERGAWVGAKSVVCPGVVLQSHSILSVGSVATKNLDAYGIYQGIPATKKKDRIID